MNMPKWLMAGLLCLAPWPETAQAQSDDLGKAFQQGVALSQAGRYAEAVPFLRRALALGERRFGPEHPTTTVFLNKLALLYYALMAAMQEITGSRVFTTSALSLIERVQSRLP